MAALATDNFNRADADPIGGNWTTETGLQGFKIVSNQSSPTAAGNDCSAYNTNATWPNDQYSQATIATVPLSVSSGDGLGVSCRVSSSATTHYEAVTGTVAATSLAKRVAGAYTQLGTSATTFASNDVIYIEAQGTAIKVKKNGSQLISVTDSAVTAGSAGMFYSGEGGLSVGGALDDWEGGDFTSSTTLFAQAIM